MDNGTIFNGTRVIAFTQEYGIRILNSTPYYAQANGQAEATNKIIKNNLRKIVARNPTSWDDLLFEVLWAYRTSKRMSINTTPYSLVFGHDAVFPMEITVRSMRITRQNELTHLQWRRHLEGRVFLGTPCPEKNNNKIKKIIYNSLNFLFVYLSKKK